MTQDKTLRQRVRDGEVLVALRGSLNTTKSQLADIWATGRYDYIWIDGQHTAFSEESLVAYCTAAEELGIDVQLRIPHTRHAYLVGRYLDLGCSAVLVPEVMEEETVDDALAPTHTTLRLVVGVGVVKHAEVCVAWRKEWIGCRMPNGGMTM